MHPPDADALRARGEAGWLSGWISGSGGLRQNILGIRRHTQFEEYEEVGTHSSGHLIGKKFSSAIALRAIFPATVFSCERPNNTTIKFLLEVEHQSTCNCL